MSSFIILNKHAIEFRRQYLKDIRFMEGSTPHRGNKATVSDFDDLLHFEGEFVGFVMETRYPFANDYYKIKTGSTIKKEAMNNADNFVPMTSEKEFKSFLKFVKKEYGLVLSDELASGRKAIIELPNMTHTLNDTLSSQSHMRMHSVLSKYQHHYQKLTNPKPLFKAPEHEAAKNQLFIAERFFRRSGN